MFLWGSEYEGLLISKDSEDNVNEFVHDSAAGHLGQLRIALLLIVAGEDRIEIFSIALSGNIGSDRHTQCSPKVFRSPLGNVVFCPGKFAGLPYRWIETEERDQLFGLGKFREISDFSQYHTGRIGGDTGDRAVSTPI